MRALSTMLGVCALVLLCACEEPHRLPPNWPGAGDATTLAGGAEAAAGSPACGKTARPSGVSQRRVSVFGKERAYTLVVPSGYDAGRSYPLVFVLHGHGGTGAKIRASFDLESAAGGKAIFVYPEGRGGWDLDSAASKNADVALFDAILAVTQADYCVDLHRVFATGFSNGAYMANQLACRRGDRIRGVATHGGGGPYEVSGEYDEQGNLVCRGRNVASLVVHGAADGTVLPSEGQKSIDHFTHANHCGSARAATPSGCVEYQSCSAPVMACKVPGLGHGLWGQASKVTWSFFDSLR